MGGKKYLWDGLDVLQETNLSGALTQRLFKGHTPIAGIGSYVKQDLAGTVIYPHKNQVGTTMRHTDGGQNVVNVYEYDAWGQPFQATQGVAQQFRFTGKELDPDFLDFNSVNRRYHFPARFYLPFRGVFGQLDPLTRLGARNSHKLLVLGIADVDTEELVGTGAKQFALRLARSGYGIPQPNVHTDPTGLQAAPNYPNRGNVSKKQQETDRKKYPPSVTVECPQLGEGLVRAIREAFTDAYNRVVTLRAGPNTGRNFKESVLDCFVKATIECDACCDDCADWGQRLRPVPGAIEPAVYLVGTVKLCLPKAFIPSICGPLGSTILHELVHCAGKWFHIGAGNPFNAEEYYYDNGDPRGNADKY